MKWRAVSLLLFIVIAFAACQSEEELEFARYYSGGKVIYQSRCQNCHGSDGNGLAALIPALNNLGKYKNSQAQLACLIRYGSHKSSKTGATNTFGSEMPATDLPAVDVAKVITFITNSYGNKLGTTTTQQAEEALKKCK